MPLVEYTKTFKRKYKKKTEDMKDSIDRAIRLLGLDPHYPGLETHKVGGTKGVFESYVDKSNRLTWEWAEADHTISLRTNCNHDLIKRSP